MSKFLITGGVQRESASNMQEGQRFKEARLLKVDFEAGTADTLLSYKGTPGAYAIENPNVLFSSATLAGDKLYLCTETEVFVYEYPSLTLLKKASHHCFQNVHHVAPVGEYIGVASTGLDMVVLLDPESLDVVKHINPMGKEPWHRFSRDTDYRMINSTKPHEIHPNFVFELNGQIWTTRFNQKDAICLDDMSKKIDIGIERIHDGHVIGDFIYFTTVNGFVVIVSALTLKIEEMYNLNEMEDTEQPLGWCRGMARDGDTIYVGFSRLRKTKIKENLKWVLSHLGKEQMIATHVSAYDTKALKKTGEFVLPVDSSNVIYSILPCN